MSHGYGKFVVDANTISVLEQNMHKITCGFSRKQLYTIMFDMIKSGDISGS